MFATIAISVAAIGQNKAAILEQKRAEALKRMETLSEEQFVENFKKYHSQVPTQRPLPPTSTSKAGSSESNTKSELSVPDDMIFPNEADEVQAILMTWLYDSYTVNGDQPAEQLFDGKGIPYSGSSSALVDVYSIPDVSSTSPYARIFAALADGIQHNAEVWINIWNGSDSTLIKNYMTSRSTPLTNYRFFVNPGNSFWYRDCGPVAFYFGDQDSIAFMDFEYYGGRPLDDKLPVFIGEQAGFPVYTNTIEYEGGNILLDGVGSLFTSSAVYSLNMDGYGLYVQDENDPYQYSMESKQPLTKVQVNDSLTHLLNLSRCLVLPSLLYDGGTGHVDLYMDMLDENTFVSTKHPDVMANLSDPKKVEANMDSICKLLSMHGSNYFNTRIPLPAKNNGSWYSSQAEYNNSYTRSFSNHTFVNQSIMQPVFYKGSSGDVAGNQRAIEIMKDRYSGYEMTEIDVRYFDGAGGAIHCITKQIPADNPVRIYHDPIRFWNTTINQTFIPTIEAIIQNKSGIAQATLSYRSVGETAWQTIALDDQTDNLYTCVLPLAGGISRDTIEYFISATSNNGKTMQKPITAPQGFYRCVYGNEVTGLTEEPVYSSLISVEPIANQNISDFYPNPANEKTELQIEGGLKQDVKVRLLSVKGQVLNEVTLKQGSTSYQLDVQNMKAGSYWVIFGQGGNTAARKLVVTK